MDELDLEVGLSGALYGGGAPASLRRARLTAQHVRDESFEEYRAISAPEAIPVEIRRVSDRIQRRCTQALATISAARAEHSRWVRENVSAVAQVAAAQRRLASLRGTMGDPAALVAELSSRYRRGRVEGRRPRRARRRGQRRRGGEILLRWRRGPPRIRPWRPSPTWRPLSARCDGPRAKRGRWRRRIAWSRRPRRRCRASSPRPAPRCGRRR